MSMHILPFIVAASSPVLSCDEWNRLADDFDNRDPVRKGCEVAETHLHKGEFRTVWRDGFKGDLAHSLVAPALGAVLAGAVEACGTPALASMPTGITELADDGSLDLVRKEVAIHGTSAIPTPNQEKIIRKAGDVFDNLSRYRLDDPYGCAQAYRERARLMNRRPPNCPRNVPCI